LHARLLELVFSSAECRQPDGGNMMERFRIRLLSGRLPKHVAKGILPGRRRDEIHHLLFMSEI
jgi:hypothetical protein